MEFGKQDGRRTPLFLLGLLCGLALVFGACSDDGGSGSAEGGGACTEGEVQACTCDDGRAGTQSCFAGTFFACSCTGAVDTGAMDAGTDTTARPDITPGDTGSDTTSDTATDGGSDATTDSGTDTAPDAPIDTTPPDEICANGIDDDRDGDVDCADSDCAQESFCEAFQPRLVAWWETGESRLQEVWMASTDDSLAAQPIEDGGGNIFNARSPAFNGDGTLLAYSYADNTISSSIRILNLTDGSKTDIIVSEFVRVLDLATGSDGTTLYFSAEALNTNVIDVYSVSFDGTNLTGPLVGITTSNPLDPDANFAASPDATDDGTIYYAFGVPGDNSAGNLPPVALWSMDADGSNKTELDEFADIQGRLTVTGDGGAIIYSNVNDRLQVYNIGTGETADSGTGSDPSGIAGTRFAVIADSEDLFLLDTSDRSRPVRITTSAAQERGPVGSPATIDAFPLVLGE